MASVVYTATRALATGHDEGDPYVLDFDTSKIDRPQGTTLKAVQKSINGAIETQFYGEERIWNVVTTPVQLGSTEEELMMEFLRSTADGGEFSFDPYGTELAPVTAIQCVREDEGYTEDTFQEVNGVGDYVTFTFKAREV